MTVQSRSPLRAAGRCHAQACRGGQCGALLGLDRAGLDRLRPLHVIVSLDGKILRAGPTVSKLRPGQDLVGSPFLSHFDFRLPRDVASVADLAGRSGASLRLSLRDHARTGLKGQVVGLECGRAVLIDLSFGIAVVDAARRFALTSSDFGGTDLGIEMLFLAEAQHAALAETRRFSRRLDSARAAAEMEASTDRLTGVRNRRAMDHLLSDLIAQAAPFSLLQLDIDNFKEINDRFGHPGGDAVLREVAAGLQDCVRQGDMVARIGGDEFVVIVPRATSGPPADALAERILERLAFPIADGDPPWRLRVSLGALFGEPGGWASAEDVLDAADAALFAAKRGGGGRFVVVPAPV